MTIEQLGRRIGLPEDGIRCAERAMPPQENMRWLLGLLEKDEAALLKELGESVAPNQLALALFMQYGAQQAPRWLEQGLPEMVCYDTLRDIAIWCRECVRLTGQAGVIQWEWVLHSLKRRVYRLGRLQYQPRVLKEPVFVGERIYPGGTMILEVHIPADGRLEQKLVMDSLQQAQTFFRKGGYTLFHCHSWLLSRALCDILDRTSNILAFQSLFEVYDEDYSYQQAEERVFGYIEERLEMYPEVTGLQKALKRYLLAGKRIGMARGVLLFQEDMNGM